MGRVRLTEDESWREFEVVDRFEREYRRDIAELGPQYRRPSPDRKWRVTYVTFVQYGLVAALISVLIVGALSFRVH